MRVPTMISSARIKEDCNTWSGIKITLGNIFAPPRSYTLVAVDEQNMAKSICLKANFCNLLKVPGVGTERHICIFY